MVTDVAMSYNMRVLSHFLLFIVVLVAFGESVKPASEGRVSSARTSAALLNGTLTARKDTLPVTKETSLTSKETSTSATSAANKIFAYRLYHWRLKQRRTTSILARDGKMTLQ